MSLSDELRTLYQEVILDHYKHPRNFGPLEPHDHEAKGFNPLCGDAVSVFLRISDGVVDDVSFEGQGCAISTASASLMTEAVKGKTIAEAEAMFDAFRKLVTGEDASGTDLGKLEVLAGVREYPVRIKCAILAWHALHSALVEGGAVVTTE